MAGRWKCVERSIDIYGEGKETKGKTAGKMGVKELLKDIGVDWEQAYDKGRWMEVVLAAKSLNGS